MPGVVVLGSINTDFTVLTPRLPSRGETIRGTRFFRAGGGKGANQAVAASRLGASCAMIAAVGNDPEGDTALKELTRENVDTSHIVRKNTHSGVALIFVEEATGENEIVVAPGANDRLSPEDISSAAGLFEKADVFLAQLEIPLETVLEGFRLARDAGLVTILNPAPAPDPRTLSECLELADFVSPNRGEITSLTGDENPESAAQKLLEKGPKGVLVTLGSEGALLATTDGVVKHRGFKVSPVDTVGAGDAFNGALAVGLAERMPLERLLAFACAAGAIAVTKEGARPSQPFREEVEELLANSP